MPLVISPGPTGLLVVLVTVAEDFCPQGLADLHSPSASSTISMRAT